MNQKLSDEIKLSPDIVSELKQIVGQEFVSTDIEVRANYSRDMTEQIAPSLIDVAVLPDNVEQVQKIVKLAYDNEIPITPYVAGANVGGLTLPHKGGITIDFKRMRRVLKIDRENKYIVVEPGFTFGDLRRLFDTELTEFRYSFPFSPPYTSAPINALLHGLGSLSVLYGSADNFLNGLEVVLPTGEIAQIGNHAVNRGEYWYGRAPLPDLCGLFIGMQGTTGIATKISLQLMDRPKILKHFAIIPKDPYEFLKDTVHRIVKLHVCDEIGIAYLQPRLAQGLIPEDMIELMGKLMSFLSRGRNTKIMKKLWPFLKVISLGKPFPLVKAFAPLLRLKSPEESYAVLICGVTIGADNKKLFKAKVKTLKKYIKKQECLFMPPSDFGDLQNVFMSILDLPVQLPAFYDIGGGGLTWVGSYVPASNVADGFAESEKVLRNYGINYFAGVLRPMKSDHYFVLRYIIPFNSIDAKMIERVKNGVRGLAQVILDIGGVPYKMAPWAAKMVWEKADPSFYKLLKRVKDMMDPKGIMNPGKLFVMEDD